MPIYDYQCEKCGVEFEQRMKMEEVDTSVPCPDCGSKTILMVSAPALVDAVRIGVKKAPADFQKYVLGRIKDSVPGNVIGKGKSGPLARDL
jgi:putative FmdB family regulatory protein